MQSDLNYVSAHFGGNATLLSTETDLHYGHIVERTVRRNHMGISEIARKLCISRRTLYNWFDTNKLDIQTILKIGSVVGHDFSQEFPEEFAKIDQQQRDEVFTDSGKSLPEDAVYYWMDKYIKLLEKFNETLAVSVFTKKVQ
jgi:DNA-binding phage protein